MRMKPISLVLLLAATLAGGLTLADDATDGAQHQPRTLEERRAHREAMRERWANMSEEEREAFRQERRGKGGPGHRAMRKRFENLSEEDRAAMRERWEGMSEEEREAMRRKMHERGPRKHGPRNGPAGGPEA